MPGSYSLWQRAQKMQCPPWVLHHAPAVDPGPLVVEYWLAWSGVFLSGEAEAQEVSRQQAEARGKK